MNNAKKILLGLGVTSLSFASQAAVDTDAIQAAILADVATVAAYGFALLIAVLSAVVGIKLVKKFTGSAT